MSANESRQRGHGAFEDVGERHSQHGLSLQRHHVLAGLILLRLVNVLCTGRTFFQPDEYFQALEPAWNLAFGPHSGAWLTWEWKHQLRSSIHPAVFAVAYAAVDRITSLLPWLPSSKASLLVALPKLVQAAVVVVNDFYTWKLAERVYGEGSRSAWSALAVTVLNPWQWYCSARTFSNSLETTITIAALTYWPWELLGDATETRARYATKTSRLSSLRTCLCLAAFAVLLRPTNVLIWLNLVSTTICRPILRGRSPITFRVVLVLLREAILCGTVMLVVSALSDRLYFGYWTFPPYRFLQFNLSQDLAVFYGEMDWHYYLSQGITQLTMAFLPFTLVGLYKSIAAGSDSEATAVQINTLKALSLAVISTIIALSLISHKEVRFILPLLPILHILAAPSFASFFSAPPGRQPSQIKIALLAGLILVNLVVATYLSLFHAAAPIAVMHFLRHEYERIHPDRLSMWPSPPVLSHHHTFSSFDSPTGHAGEEDQELFALFLVPCHATPWRSHLVYPSLRARALTCEPPLHTAPRSVERASYQDETRRFYRGFGQREDWGVDFLMDEIWPVTVVDDDDSVGSDDGSNGAKVNGEIPRYIVGFESIEPVLRKLFNETAKGELSKVKLRKVWRGRNGLFSDDERKEGSLAVWDTGLHL